MADRTSLPRAVLVPLALAGVGLLGLGLWWMESHKGAAETAAERAVAAAEQEAAAGEGEPSAARSEAGGVEQPGPGPSPRVRIAGRVDLGRASGEPVDDLQVLAFERPLEAADLFGFQKLEPGEEPSATRPAATLEPARYAWEDELERLAPAAVAAVDAAGRFELEAPVGFGAVHLALVGDRVHSPGTQRVLPGGAEPVVLRGRSGSLIEGRLIPDPSVGELDLARWTVTLERGFTGSIDMMSASADLYERRVEVRPDGRFRLRGFPLEGRFDLLAVGPGAGPGQAPGLEFTPGGTLRADIVLGQGARVRGRVTDEAGDPLAGAEVHMARSAVLAGKIDGLAPAVADAYGRFEIEHGLTGRVQLVASADGYLSRRFTLPEPLQNGSEVDDVWIRLASGLSLGGVVRHADGRPAADVAVRVELPAATRAGLKGFGAQDAGANEVRTDASGTFVVRGLADYEFDVIATFEGPDGELLRGRADAVEPGPAGERSMELLLAPTRAIVGRVEAADGGVVQDFELTVRRALASSGSSNPFELSGRTETRPFLAADGAFAFDGLGSGEWELRAEARGSTGSPWIPVTLPSEESLAIVLESAGWAEGRVLDPLGAPVAGARVELVQTVGERLQRLRSSGLRFALTDSEGAFRFELDAGESALRAQGAGLGMSEEVQLELEPGARRAGLVLRLTEPAQLTGEVFGTDGEPLVGAMASLQRVPRFDTSLTARVDEAGGFRFDAVTAGRYQLLVVPSRDDPSTDLAEILSGVLIETVELRERESVHRVLGRTVEDPVEVQGRVLLGGEPVPGALLSWFPAADESLVSRRLATTDDRGQYLVELARPGAYQILVQATEGRNLSQSNASFSRRIAAGGPALDIDLELPEGRLAGRVLDPSGAPAAKCRVVLHPEGGCVIGGVFGHGFVELLTEADGSFDVHYLEAGTYRLVAGGRPVLGVIDAREVPGRSAALEVELPEDGERQGLELVLAPTAVLTGTVLDAEGEGVPQADLFVREADGTLVDRLSAGQTTASGRFELLGFGPGEYRVSARAGEWVTPADSEVRLSAETPAALELRLVRGVDLRVEVLDQADGLERTAFDSGARLSVVDESGAEFATLASVGDLYEAYSTGFAESERTLGPLPPGRYRVTVTTADGRSKSKTVELEDQELRSVKLRLR